jgi:hypothetical protein
VKTSSKKTKLYNKLIDSWQLGNKKALFANMKRYYKAMHRDPFDVLPVTFHVKAAKDSEHEKFKSYLNKIESKSMWIIKPGENTNCGRGIQVSQDPK